MDENLKAMAERTNRGDPPTWAEFHAAWTASVGAPAYVKALWLLLEQRLRLVIGDHR